MQADERRSSEWQDWRLSLGGLRGGMIERGGIGGESDLEMGDFNIEEDDFLDYGSEGTDLDEMLNDELNQIEVDENEKEDEMEEFKEQDEPTEGVHCDAESAEEKSGFKFLEELDKDFVCSPRLIVRGEYEGKVNGTTFKLIVRGRTEGTYVDWGLFNMKTKKQILLVRGEMTYPYSLTKARRNEKDKSSYGRGFDGGWAWDGFGYGYINLNGLSDWFRRDPRVLHVDMLEAVFYGDELYHVFHLCGPNCKNVDKSEGVQCNEWECGLRIWSLKLTTFKVAHEEHDLRPTSFSKEEEVQTIFLSLVRFFDGQVKVVIHRDKKIRRYDKEVIWLSPVPNPRFDDSVAGIDRNRLEKAKQIFKTSVPRPVAENCDALPKVRLFHALNSLLVLSPISVPLFYLKIAY